MAMKIPDAPNVIGTQPVLREIDSINPVSERPNFRVDVSVPVEAVKNVGNAYADYVEYNTNIWMGAACNQFTHDLLSEEQRLKDTHTELQANDLYSKLEKYATGVLDDMTGAPKDDGRVRIANPELQKRFRDWASKQMPAYQSRMMNYTASELDKANTKILKQGIEDTNKFIIGSSYETAAEEFDAAWPSYVRAAQLSAPGMPEDYQMAEAARMMDEAVYAKMKMLADNSIPEAVQWYYGVPAVQKSLSSKSTAAFFDEIEKNYEEQGGAWGAGELDAGASGLEGGMYLDPKFMEKALPRLKTKEQRAAMAVKVYDKAREIHDARSKAQQGMLEHQLSAIQGRVLTTNLNDPNAVVATYQEYHNADPMAADAWFMSVQKGLSDAKIESDFYEQFPLGDPIDRSKFEDMLADTIGQSTTEDLLGKSLGEVPEITVQQADLLNRHAKVVQDTSAWINSPVYTEYLAKAAAGQYHGENAPALYGMPFELYNNIRQTAYYTDRYNEAIRQNPHIDTDLKSRVKDYGKPGKQLYANNLKREAVKAFDRYKNDSGGRSFPVRGSIEYENILDSIVKGAKSPTEVSVEHYLTENAIDYLNTQHINPYLNPKAAWNALDDVDSLPLNLRVAKKIKDKSELTATQWADAIISATPRMKRHRIEPYREAMIKHIDETGNADVWYQFIDGIGE